MINKIKKWAVNREVKKRVNLAVSHYVDEKGDVHKDELVKYMKDCLPLDLYDSFLNELRIKIYEIRFNHEIERYLEQEIINKINQILS